MATQLLEQYVRLQIAVTEYAADLRERMDDESGQTTVEWLVIMVGLTALAVALVASGVWDNVAKGIASAVKTVIDKTVGHAQ
jgi:Flp pilus assembly pilin Flp